MRGLSLNAMHCAALDERRLPKLSRAQLDQVETELAKGAKAHGYRNDLWPLATRG